MKLTWKPTATIEQLKKRSTIINNIRAFFSKRSILEVDTPSLSHRTVTDIHLSSFKTSFIGPNYTNGTPIYLITSPEFHMKRLLAAGSGSIYQICKSFRNNESGSHNSPEFTMLEWYRVDFNHHQLMDEVDELLQLILNSRLAERISYQQAFIDALGICPLEDPIEQLQQAALRFGLHDSSNLLTNRDMLLQLLFSFAVEKTFDKQVPIFVYNFPSSQALLARINANDKRVADRFELYFNGIELANGFYELNNPKEQLARFKHDNLLRIDMGLPSNPIDYHLIDAIQSGLPNCSGVALGIDRLVMLALGCDNIDQVMAFPFYKA
ncbi:hypothetical protein CF66_2103 [Candidatus Photodesmus katoptron]|uniref:tRNA synthetases class II n=1 Tax=Candidatus Photodesmus katoptron Akat1 TaxID=1236703 RepID=S3E105_9GAMM|nr:elongation factor P--(R)-beta-lysine ligase [Candidatus Photodesmus katoptron]EPE37841.1 tRNA synthetases class II [Candidatus Photodesmus katoptron Akat1]KEY90440.1 hypothetical protein CF66_2103 [Candidatus Photodesmus katoptron]